MENVQFTKIDDNTLEVTQILPAPPPNVTQYNRAFIESQILSIQNQKSDFDALRDAEILECQNILASMDSLGIV